MKVALVLRGLIHTDFGKMCNVLAKNQTEHLLNSIYKSTKKHILDPNKDHNIDIFIHSWNPELQNELINLYKPINYTFENNINYSNEIIEKIIDSEEEISRFTYNQTSMALSLKKCCEIVENHSTKNNINYDIVIIYRLDMILVEDVILDNYDKKYISVNCQGNKSGDIYFIMSYENILKFKNLYDSISTNNKPHFHRFVKVYINNYINLEIYEDNNRHIYHAFDLERVKKQNLNKLYLIPDLKCGSGKIKQGYEEKKLKIYEDIPSDKKTNLSPFGEFKIKEHYTQDYIDINTGNYTISLFRKNIKDPSSIIRLENLTTNENNFIINSRIIINNLNNLNIRKLLIPTETIKMIENIYITYFKQLI